MAEDSRAPAAEYFQAASGDLGGLEILKEAQCPLPYNPEESLGPVISRFTPPQVISRRDSQAGKTKGTAIGTPPGKGGLRLNHFEKKHALEHL